MQAPKDMRLWWAQALIAAGVLVVVHGLGDGDWRWPAFLAPVLAADIGLRAYRARRRATVTPGA